MKFFYYPGSCSLASRIILEECGASYDSVKVNLREGQQRASEFLELNPKGKVPALLLDDGTAVTENPAIMMHLADAHPAAGLFASPGERERARSTEWLLWCASTIHPAFSPIFSPARHIDGEEAQKALVAKARELVAKHLELFNQQLTGRPYVLGDRFSIADAYTPVFWHWSKKLGIPAREAHRNSVQKIISRPAAQRALAAEEVRLEI